MFCLFLLTVHWFYNSFSHFHVKSKHNGPNLKIFLISTFYKLCQILFFLVLFYVHIESNQFMTWKWNFGDYLMDTKWVSILDALFFSLPTTLNKWPLIWPFKDFDLLVRQHTIVIIWPLPIKKSYFEQDPRFHCPRLNFDILNFTIS